MKEVNIKPKSPEVDFDSKFSYAWKVENDKSQVMIEHYTIKWSVVNLKFLLQYDNKCISSPHFLLDSSKTQWYIKMYPNGFRNNKQATSLYLYRLEKGGFRKVGVTFRFGILKPDDSVVWLKEKKIPKFSRSSCYGITMKTDDWTSLSQYTKEFKQNIVVLCDMYITYKTLRYRPELLSPADYDLINFSFDFTKMLLAKESTDYTVKVSLVKFRTHKVILAARSPVFEDIIKYSEYETAVEFDDVSTENMRRLLRFMYSGNLSLILRDDPPNTGFYECAKKFTVPDLLNVLHPKEISLRSAIQSQEVNFMWFINDFNCYSMQDIVSPEFSPVNNYSKWKLILNFSKLSDQISILAETTTNTKTSNFLMKISLVDENNELTNTQVITKFDKYNDKYGFPTFLNEFSVHNEKSGLMIDDTLRIYCQVQLLLFCETYEWHDSYAIERITFLDLYQNLSSDLHRLLDKPGLSDVAIKTLDGIMSLHKSILFARSRNFYSKFLYYNKGETTINVTDVDPDTVYSMIQHAYSGILKPMKVDDLFKLHQAADQYVFRQLILISLHNLASQINVENLLQFYKKAKEFKIAYIQAKCESFVRENAKTVLEIADWEGWYELDTECAAALLAQSSKCVQQF